MKVFIIEDEIHNLRMLKGMLLQLRPDWQIVGTADSISASVKWLEENMHPDLMLMDIQLTDGICFSIFEKVKVESQVIFITAYDNFAIQAFKVNSIDYLLKPIKESEFEIALVKFEKYFVARKPVSEEKTFQEFMNAFRKGVKQYRKRFLISGATSYYKLETKEIAFFYSENKVATAVTFTNQKHVIDFTLEQLESELDHEIFFRANRACILHIESIQRFEDYFGGKLLVKLVAPFNEKVSISRLKTTAFKHWVGN